MFPFKVRANKTLALFTICILGADSFLMNFFISIKKDERSFTKKRFPFRSIDWI
jgi:hypothetical protein